MSAPEPFDVAVALRGMEGDRQLLGKLAGMLLAELPAVLAALRQSLERQDGPALARHAHHLAGGLAMLAAQPSLELARRLETSATAGDWNASSTILASLEDEAQRLRTALAACIE